MGVFSFVKAGGKKFGSIVGVAPKVNKSKITKATDDVKLTALKARGQMKKQSQDFKSQEPSFGFNICFILVREI